MTILRKVADIQPGQTDNSAALIIPGDENLTILQSDLTNQIKVLQAQFSKLGIGRQKTVVLCLPNSVEFIVTFLATTWQGATVAPLNPALKQEELEFYLQDLQPTIVVVPQKSREQNSAAVRAAKTSDLVVAECWRDGSNIIFEVDEPITSACQQADIEDTPDEEDVALVLHTSGTTGRPKIVLTETQVPLTHRNLSASVENICKSYALTTTDRTMLVMPLFHIHGIVASFLATLQAGSAIIMPSRLSPSFWKDFASHEATWYTASPTMHQIIMAFPEPDPKPSIRFIRSCSSPLSLQVFESLESRFGAPVLEAYAMTEAAHQIITNPLPPASRRAGSVGLASSGIEMCLLSSQGDVVTGEEQGEICIRGPSVMGGYRSNDEANASAFTADGYFRTGDYGRRDKEGYLYLTGRIKEFINKGGEKIGPVELENVISTHPSVSEVVVFAIDDAMYGEEVGAAVRLKEGETVGARDLQKWIRQKVAPHRVPKQIWFPTEIPKTATGKLQRRLVAQKMQEDTNT